MFPANAQRRLQQERERTCLEQSVLRRLKSKVFGLTGRKSKRGELGARASKLSRCEKRDECRIIETVEQEKVNLASLRLAPVCPVNWNCVAMTLSVPVL